MAIVVGLMWDVVKGVSINYLIIVAVTRNFSYRAVINGGRKEIPIDIDIQVVNDFSHHFMPVQIEIRLLLVFKGACLGCVRGSVWRLSKHFSALITETHYWRVPFASKLITLRVIHVQHSKMATQKVLAVSEAVHAKNVAVVTKISEDSNG